MKTEKKRKQPKRPPAADELAPGSQKRRAAYFAAKLVAKLKRVKAAS